MSAHSPQTSEGYFKVDKAELFYRQIGKGQPIIVLHGGPDFDHTYLLPDLDLLSDSYQLIYYDQRGRGKSRGDLLLENISIKKFTEDLDSLRKYLQLEQIAVLGHSWGGHLALQYALHYPKRLSYMILMNTAPASYEDGLLIKQEIRRKRAPYEEKLSKLASSSEFREGDPNIVTEYYMTVFSTTFKKTEHFKRLNLGLTSKEDIIRGRKVEDKLMEGLYWTEGFNIFPQLKHLSTPTLLIHGDNDFIPVYCAAHIADTIPGAKLVVIKDCGHFSYIEAPGEIRKAINEFLKS